MISRPPISAARRPLNDPSALNRISHRTGGAFLTRDTAADSGNCESLSPVSFGPSASASPLQELTAP